MSKSAYWKYDVALVIIGLVGVLGTALGDSRWIAVAVMGFGIPISYRWLGVSTEVATDE